MGKIMKMYTSRFVSALLICCAVRFARADDTRHLVTDSQTGAVTMQAGGKTCWTYVPQSNEGKPYFSPLAIPGTGDVFTSHRPPDHTWHLGFWFSWKYINDCNFWEPDTNGVTHVLSQTLTPSDDRSFSTCATLAYLAKGKEAVREQRTVKVTTQPNGNYTIAWDSTFTAQGEDAVFSCTPAKKDKNGIWATGGYAGLMLRLADSPGFSYTYENGLGQTDVKTCGEKSDKMVITATCAASGARARITFTGHPDNPRHPTPWFARYNPKAQKGRGYYLVGPSVIFHEPLRLAAGASLRFRYTFTVERL